jgi:chromosome segregation ATPase
MDALQRMVSLLRRLLTRERRSAEPEDVESQEFRDLLDGVGAEPVEDEHARQLLLRDATISELRASLAQLQPLGEELALSEKGRMTAEQEVAALRSRIDAMRAEAEAAAERKEAQPTPTQAGTTSLREALKQETRRSEGLRKRLETTNAKLEERRSVAAERWRELCGLRSERTGLARELKAARRRQERIRGLVKMIEKSGGDAPEALARLVRLMQAEPPERNAA